MQTSEWLLSLFCPRTVRCRLIDAWCLQVANERGFTLGTTRLQVAHLPDGSTGFWGSAPGGKPIAKRLRVDAPPWQASLEVQGTDKAQVELECSTEGWQYSLDLSTPRQFRKGLRSVVAVQVCPLAPLQWPLLTNIVSVLPLAKPSRRQLFSLKRTKFILLD
jgi:hypothetical protein